jgi:hypothetical protein
VYVASRRREPLTALKEQVGNPTSTTSHLKRRETKDAQGSAHFFKIYKWFFKMTFKIDPKSPPKSPPPQIPPQISHQISPQITL